MKYLFLLTISPVQSFIEQARKTSDLKAGSQILSDLITFAMNELKPNNPEFIFPHPNIDSKPNRFITILETEENMQTFGDNLKTKIQNYFLEQAEKCLAKTGFFESCKEQLEDFFKIYWVAKKYDEQLAYQDQHKRLEELLGAVKANRPFKQLAEKGRKCSNNGELNVKFYRKTSDETKKDKSNEIKQGNLLSKLFHTDVCVVNYNDYSKIEQDELQAGEGLCAISFLKRKWKIGEGSFPAVSEIALMNVVDQLKATKESEVISAIKLITQINDQFFYEEAVTPKEFERVMEISSQKGKANLEAVKDLQSIIGKATKKLNLSLSKYYAILVFDADSMGNALKGRDKTYQKAISYCLGDFAKKATHYIDGTGDYKTQKGKTVYAGGDDFLGFINLDYLFEAMQWLRKNFDLVINQEMVKFGHDNPNLTFSAGIAIAHYKTPLTEVLTWARSSEKLAKSKYKDSGKNAFCLAVLKHSGEIHQTAWKWSYDGNLTSTLDTISDLLQRLIEEDLSSKFIKNLDAEFRKMLDENGQITNILKPMFAFELERLMLRGRSNGFSKQDTKKFAADIFQLFDKGNTLNMSDCIQLIEIVDFLHRHVNSTKSILQTENILAL